ncbi:hypothetical protein Vretimale_2339 [Volvox reticuliferus]|uniref:Uncharacterized protein n=1 Tax=Volvox reticuliferus TaxID=1737510 RepID=A0A8J4D6A8_9CHLO|nr:hypothetical protein Vretifemale_4644 [Volvox reticuliferus]GIL96549.1 hypothetical protein Vretimale_2339 [Volvox reticuliferus]
MTSLANWKCLKSVRADNARLHCKPASTGRYIKCIKCSVYDEKVAAQQLFTQPFDLLLAKTSSGGTETLQVLEGGDGATFTALWKGHVLRLTAMHDYANEESWTTERIGAYPLAGSDLVRAFPSLQGRLLEDLHSHSGAPEPVLTSLSNAYSLTQLQKEVAENASFWCDGTRPGAPEKTAMQSLTLTAGELVSLMQGKRGVVIVQLWNGFDRSRGQPVYDPWVVDLLEAALRTPGVRAVPSVAPGGVGLTAVLFADKEPWNVWGPHLASFGCQANAVAGSAYYKVLIGKILGYSDENIYGYVRSVGGGLTPDVISQVDADLKKLSKAKPKLPWNREGSRGKKATGNSAAAAAAAGNSAAVKSPGSQRRGGSGGGPR